MSKGITKYEAARAQLTHAVRAFFADADLISVATLANVAREISDSILEKKGHPHYSEDFARSIGITSKELFSQTGKTTNFFKHANRDTDEMLYDFSEQEVVGRIIWACHSFNRLVKIQNRRSPKSIMLFIYWFNAINYKEVTMPLDEYEIMEKTFPNFKHQSYRGLKIEALVWLQKWGFDRDNSPFIEKGYAS